MKKRLADTGVLSAGRQLLFLPRSERTILPGILSRLPQARGLSSAQERKDQQRIQAAH